MDAKRIVSIALVLSLGAGCEDEPPPTTDGGGDSSTATAAASASASSQAAEEEAPVAFSEADFVESEESRDPYREYTSLFVRPIDDLNQELGRKVKAPMYALDELKLVGIISRTNDRAMLVDPKGYGWIVHTGDFLGRAELVSTGGTEAQEVPLNWKVDRIRPNDVVFVREDPARPQIARSTRVFPLFAAEGSGGS